MSNDGSPIRLGIIGCGRGSVVHHLPALAHMSEFKVVSVCDLDAGRLNKTADMYGIPKRFADYRTLLSEGDIEAVAVVTPTESHEEIGLAALRMKKHLFMEKPLALTLEECDRLISEASRIPCKVMVGLNSRWHRLVLRGRNLIRSGILGKLRAVRSVYTHCHPGAGAPAWHKRRALGGGVLFNDGVHHFDLWRFLLDAEVTEVFARTVASEHFDDDTSVVSARLDNGMLATGVFSFSSNDQSELEIFGEGGRLLLSLYRFDGLEFFANTSYPGSIKTRLRSAALTLREVPGALASIRSGGDFTASYDSVWRHFAECIRRDETPACMLEDGRKAIQVSLAAICSSRSGAAVKI
ncbi:MAG: Gfo/Idh/MocA family oxidoreductase [Acidobacteria bacterium]|nr:Gfo/Idh/MocA family oxidoreductase [Acidobacteriota bacterium]